MNMILLLALSLASWIAVVIFLSDNAMQIIREYFTRKRGKL
jgi:hypothetical protein